MFWPIVFVLMVFMAALMIYGDMVENKKIKKHNTLSGLQGGAANEYHYLTSSEYSKLVDVYVCKYCETLNFSKTDKCSHCFAPVKED